MGILVSMLQWGFWFQCCSGDFGFNVTVDVAVGILVSMLQEKVVKNRVPEELRQPTGRVIGIIKRKWRQYCGILQPSILKNVS